MRENENLLKQESLFVLIEPDPTPECVYPGWLTEKKQWQDMASTLRYTFSPSDTTLRIHNNNASSQKELILSALCIREAKLESKQTETFRAVTFVNRGWCVFDF